MDEELEYIEKDYAKEQKALYAKRQVERFERLSEYSLDEDNKRVYKARKEVWKKLLLRMKKN